MRMGLVSGYFRLSGAPAFRITQGTNYMNRLATCLLASTLLTGPAFAEMLARHGVRADISVLAKTMPRISDVLCRHVRDVGADVVVMGGYGHSRFREAILGGATRNMLEMAEVPVLMAH